MALNSYLTLKGEKQGDVKGSCTQEGREDTMEIFGWSHEVVSPRDAASGLPTGKRQHKPLTVSKAIDKATPLTTAILCGNENIPTWQLKCYRPQPGAGEQHYYTIDLTNANISGIRSEMLNNKYPENMNHEIREHISFTYMKIAWTWEDGGVSADDSWETPT
jgi:type VI secretion system secreted protein Hcp